MHSIFPRIALTICQEISTYFPRKVLWRAFLCSLFAAVVLKALNPNGTGKLVLFVSDLSHFAILLLAEFMRFRRLCDFQKFSDSVILI